MESSGGTAQPGRPERLVVVSNRLPVVLEREEDGSWRFARGSGGLVTALEPVLRDNTGVWVGWPGVEDHQLPEVDPVLKRESETLGYQVRGIGLSPEEEDDFYLGFSNQIVWPLFHDFQGRCNFRPRFWDAYVTVNRKFAEGVAAEARAGDFLWIHDYHLFGVGEELRRRGVDLPMGFFLHIPFPALDLFQKLPWRFPILRSLLHYDLIGFQTEQSQKNFLHALGTLVSPAKISAGGDLVEVRIGSRRIRVGVFPISIDVEEFAQAATGVEDAAADLQQALQNPAREREEPTMMLLGVDRLDYSKGIPHKLRGFREALRRFPELRGAVTLVQLVIPSREDIPEYNAMKEEIDRLVGEISGEFMRPGWTPVRYHYGRWDRPRLIAYYRAARGALVTPLKDGMNLVAKEYCAAQVREDGVLVLSEHAGATAQLQEEALLVNPYDEEDVARTIHRACTMDLGERRRRMRRLRERVQAEDIHWWVRTFLDAGMGGPARSHPPRYTPPLPEGFMEGF